MTNAPVAFTVENVRSLSRTTPLPILRDPLFRDVLAIAAAVSVIGMSYGAIAVSSGIGPVRAVAMSVLVFAGGAQFLVVGVVGAGGSVIAAVLAGLLLNARHLPFGLALGDTAGKGARRLVGSHLMVDESVAFALAQGDPARRRRAYWMAGLTLFTAWQLGTLAGVVAGGVVGDPAAFGIDAAFPAGLFALLLPALRDPAAARVAIGAAAFALAAAAVLPPGLPVLVALLGLVFALDARR